MAVRDRELLLRRLFNWFPAEMEDGPEHPMTGCLPDLQGFREVEVMLGCNLDTFVFPLVRHEYAQGAAFGQVVYSTQEQFFE